MSSQGEQIISSDPQLQRRPEGLCLVQGDMSLCADFSRMIPRLKQDKVHQEMLVKAVKIKGLGEPQIVVDATAGLGEDSLLLAAAGFEVHLFERDEVISQLLEDALLRARSDFLLAPFAQCMHLHKEDSIMGMSKLGLKPHVVLLDPMFPAKRKDASSKKKMQLFQQLEKPCPDEEDLMNAALNNATKRVVVKRPLKGPFLADRKPSYSLKGKTVRYDCIAISG